MVNVDDALVPIAVIEVKQTITIKASITAYSTAVGPSSETMNFLTPAANDCNMAILSFSVDSLVSVVEGFHQSR